MSTREGTPGVRRSDGSDSAATLLALGWALAALAVGLSAAWSLRCAACGNLKKPGGYFNGLRSLHDHGLLAVAVGPLVMSLFFVAGLGIATWVVRARRRRSASESQGDDGRR